MNFTYVPLIPSDDFSRPLCGNHNRHMTMALLWGNHCLRFIVFKWDQSLIVYVLWLSHIIKRNSPLLSRAPLMNIKSFEGIPEEATIILCYCGSFSHVFIADDDSIWWWNHFIICPRGQVRNPRTYHTHGNPSKIHPIWRNVH